MDMNSAASVLPRSIRSRKQVMRATLALATLVGILLFVACDGRKASEQKFAASLKSPDVPKLTNETLGFHLGTVATAKRELIFTTTSAWTPAITEMLKNFMFHMHAVGRDANTMVISQDEGTCENLQAMSIPCYLDEVSLRSWEFPEKHRYRDRPYDFGKIWWSLRLAELGYTSLYLDNDVAPVADPLSADIMQLPYDVQGLSDFRGSDLPHLGKILDSRCDLYRIKLDKSIPGGDVYHPSWELKKGDISVRAIAPCQSLGAYYVKPTPAAVKFLTRLSDWLRNTHIEQWDQAAWNEVVVAFTMGMGVDEPLRYRLLPVSSFMNLEVYEQRRKDGLLLKPVLLHAGFLNNEAKREKFQQLGLWHGDDWQPGMGAAGRNIRRKACGGSLARCRRRVSNSYANTVSVVLVIGGLAVIAWLALGRWKGSHGLLPVINQTGH